MTIPVPDSQSHENVSYITAEFRDAIDDLTGRRTEFYDTDGGKRIGVRDSRYQEIQDHLEGQQGSQAGGVARSMPPLWVDAVEWLRVVDAEVAQWVPDRGRADTPDRLQALYEMHWRPQDIGIITGYTEMLVRWAKRADALLDPDESHTYELMAPCPACQTKTVYRPDSGGEYVRMAALSVTAEKCTCLKCGTVWTSQYFQFLANTLGCATPEGVVA